MAENYFVPNIEIKSSISFYVFLISRFISFAYSMYLVIKIAFFKINEVQKNMEEGTKERSFFTCNKKSFFFITAIIVLAYLPYWLQYFPGIASADPVNQAMQVLGVYELTNHHPVLHSFLIFICLKISQFFIGNYSGAVGIYCGIQILALAMTFSFVLYYMAKKKINKNARILVLLIFAFFPLFPLYAITVQKDIFFAIFVTLFTIAIIEICTNTEFFSKKRNYIYLILSILGTMFFRNNGIYVIMISFFVLVIVFRKYYKQIGAVFLTCILFYYVITTWGFSKMNIKQGSVSEMLSIPVQYFARLEQRKSDELTEEEKKEINRYLPVENLGDLYNPKISDGVKRHLDKKEFEKDKVGFIKLYINLIIKHPIEALESFISGSYGYYYPDTLDWGLSIIMFESERKEEKDLNWIQEPIIQSTLIQEISNTINKRDIPILSTFYSIGFVFWMMIICGAYIIYQKEYRILSMFVPVLGVWLTSLASPVYGEMRYVLSMYTCLPIFIIFAINRKMELR